MNKQVSVLPNNLYDAARLCLLTADPQLKCALSFSVAQAYNADRLSRSSAQYSVEPISQPGRPSKPQLIAPRDLPRRGLGSVDGRGAFLHAIAHIEFNAIDLAWDAVYRFREMPDDFYRDFITIATDEARHFQLLQARLGQLGFTYGDFDAHNGLWEMAIKTAHDSLIRMALVPRVLEARGLDVTPALIEKLQSIGDVQSVAILKTILDEEVAHVAAGTRWFHWCCVQRGLDPELIFFDLIQQYAPNSLRPPFNIAARSAAGFTEHEMHLLHEFN